MDTTPRNIAAPEAGLGRARVAVSLVFLVLGCGNGLWAVHIPIVTQRLGLDPGVVGLALFTAAVGAVGTMPLTGMALGRFGSRLPTAVLALIYPVVLPLPILAPSTPFLFVVMLLFGATMGGLDVAMNMQAAEVETARRRPTMSSFHGFFSLGALAGSSLGGLLIAAGWGNGSGGVLVGIVLLAVAAWAGTNLWRSERRPAASGPRFALPPLALVGLGAITFLAFAGEGAVTDWSALFLATVKQSGAAAAASGVVAFSVAMVVCRLTGDAVVARLGRMTTAVAGGGLVAVGMIVAVVGPTPLLSAPGFAIVGIGAANLVPVAISAAARVPGISPGIAVAGVTSMGYVGFLFVPPILGFIARAWGLPASLIVVAGMGLAIAALAGSVRR